MEITVNETEKPSEGIVRAANATKALTDAQGRSIVIKRPTALDRMRLFRILGAELSGNDRYLGVAILAFSVVELEGERLLPPMTILSVEHLVQRLGDDGINAISDGLAEMIGTAQSSAEIVESAKN